MKAFYVLCCVAGVVLPYWQFLPWVWDHGIAPLALYSEIAQSRLSGFAWLDVVVSAVVLLAFVEVESKRLGIKRRWVPWAGTLVVGVSLGLPLFLLLREVHLESAGPGEAATMSS